MAKKCEKRINKALEKTKKISEKIKKLPRGYKECRNCKQLLNIHKCLCNFCGHKHDMKKRKVDIMKRLTKITPKLVRSLIELNDFNDIGENIIRNQIFTASNFKLSLEEIVIKENLKRKKSKTKQSSTILTEANE